MSSTPTTFCEAFQSSAGRQPDRLALRAFGRDLELTWRQYGDTVRSIAGGLAQLGVGKGDTVAFMLTNRPEFNVGDCAVMHLGAIAFSVYNSLAPEQLAYVISDSGAKVVITESQFVERLHSAERSARDQYEWPVEHLLCIEDGDLDALVPAPGFDFDATWRAVAPDDVLTLIYTSGTTGPPKGVELTHASLLHGIGSTMGLGDLGGGERFVSYLPSAHIADRGLSHYLGMLVGAEVTSVDDLTALAPALAEVRPTLFGAVPRVWEKLKLGVELQLATDDELATAFAAGNEDVAAAIRAKLGLDAVKWAVSGAAALAPDVMEFLVRLGVPISEVWGMSECGLATGTPPGEAKVGTVGRFLPGYEGRLADDGELLVRGPGLMKGYRNNPEKTAEAIDEDGWLHTGDIATIDQDGYVSIVDRKKELLINAAGKNMSPANIQNAIASASPLIGSVVAVGDNRPYNVALITLDADAAAAFAASHGLAADPDVLARDKRVTKLIGEAVEKGNEGLSRVEQIKRFELLPSFWEPGGDELTPTMKIRRRNILTKYVDVIDRLYEPRS